MAFIDRIHLKKIGGEHIRAKTLAYAKGKALGTFVKEEFRFNLKPGCAFTKREGEELSKLYPEIFDKYWREEFYGE